jgi:HK97 family phage major capsid protein
MNGGATMTAREKRAKAKQLHAEAQQIYDKYKGDDAPAMPDDEARKYDQLLDERDKLIKEAGDEEAREKRLNDWDAAQRREQDPAQHRGGGADPLPHNDPRNTDRPYSLCKAIRQAGSKGSEPLDGLEAETSQEIARRTNRVPQGFFMPQDLPVRRHVGAVGIPGGIERRDLTLTTGAGAKATDLQYGTWIELLRNQTLARQLGVGVIADLVGDFAIPKKTAASQAYWFNESNAPTESQPGVGQILFQPSTVGAFTDISRKFLIQSSFDAEMFVRADLADTVAIEMDRATFNGSGVGAEPEGITPKASVNIIAIGVNGGPITYPIVLAMESQLAVQNAPAGYTAWVAPPAVRGSMKAIMKATNTYSPLWDRTEVEGYPAFATNQMPNALSKGTAAGTLSAAILGVWSLAVWGFWTGLDVLVDPYTASTSGTLRVVVLQDADFQLRQDKAFSVCKDILPT